jgi:hypothetical protein
MDFESLTDEQLDAEIARQEQAFRPQPVAMSAPSQSYNHLSDDDLDARIAEEEAKANVMDVGGSIFTPMNQLPPPAMMAPLPYTPGNPLHGNIQTEAERAQEYMDGPHEAPIGNFPTSPFIGHGVQWIADQLMPKLEPLIGEQIADARQATAEQARTAAHYEGDQSLDKRNATVAGLLQAVDALGTLGSKGIDLVTGGPIARALNHPAVDPVKFDLFDQFAGQSYMKDLAARSPHMSKQQTDTAMNVAPIPGLGNIPGKVARFLPKGKAQDLMTMLAGGVEKGHFLPTVGNLAAEGAIVAGAQDAGTQLKDTDNIDLGRVAQSALAGAGIGAGLGAVPVGILRGLIGAHGLAGKASKKLAAPTAADKAIIANMKKMSADDLARLLGNDPDNAELQALLALRGQVQQDVTTQTATQAEVPSAPPKEEIDYDALIQAIADAPNKRGAESAMRKVGKLVENDKMPKSWKKEKRRQIEDAYTYYRGRAQTGTAPIPRSTSPQPTFESRLTAPSNEPPMPPPPPLRNVNKLQGEVSINELPEHVQQYEFEKAKFPLSQQPLAIEKVTTQHSKGGNFWSHTEEGQALMPSDLSDAQLADELDRIGIDLQRPSFKGKKDAEKLSQQLQQEALRRDHRRLKGWAQDWAQAESAPAPTQRAAADMSDQELSDLLNTNPERVEEIMTEFDRRYPDVQEQASPPQAEPTKPQPPAADEPQGEFRYRRQDNLGREKYIEEKAVDVDTIHAGKKLEHLRAIKGRDYMGQDVTVADASKHLLQAKADANYAEQLYEDYVRKLLDHYDAPEKDGVRTLTAHKLTLKEKVDIEPGVKLQGKIDNLREKLASGTKPGPKGGIETGLAENFKTTGRLQSLPMPKSKDSNSADGVEAFKLLARLKERVSKSQSSYKNMKAHYTDMFKEAEMTHRANRDNEHLLLNAGAEVFAIDPSTGDKTSRSLGPVRGQIQHTHDKIRLDLDERAKNFAKAVQDVVLAKRPDLGKKTTTHSATKAKAAIGGGGIFAALAGGVKAEAADLAQAATPALGNAPLWADPNVAAVAVTAGAIVAAGKQTAKWAIKSKIPYVSHAWNDTMDRVKQLDNILGTKLESELWEHVGLVYQNTFGVHFPDETVKQQAINELRDRTRGMTAQDALAGVGIFGKLSQEQREAIVIHGAVQTKIRKLIKDHRDTLLAYQKAQTAADPDWKDPLVDFGEEALNAIDNAINPRKSTLKLPGVTNLVGVAMDNFFFWNPDHHATNLMDQVFSGGMKVGLGNIAKANLLLMPVTGNSKLKAMFKTSNLVGGMTAERTQIKANAAQQRRNLKETIDSLDDLPSDKINADRVALGSFLQYAQKNKADWKTWGVSSDVDFAEKLLTDPTSLPPEVVMKSWAHMSDITSRTLGVDPFRMNSDFLSRWEKVGTLGVFFKQQARFSRLLARAVAEGNYKEMAHLAGLFGVMTLAAGHQTVPEEIQATLGFLNPDGWFKTAKAMDSLEIARNVTGETLGPKLSNRIFGVSAVTNLGIVEKFHRIPEDIGTLLEILGLVDGEEKTRDKRTARLVGDAGFTVGSFFPRPLAAVARTAQKALSADIEAKQGEKTIYEKTDFFKPEKVKVDLAASGESPMASYLDQFIPGTRAMVDEVQQGLWEKRVREGHDAFFGKWFGHAPTAGRQVYPQGYDAEHPTPWHWSKLSKQR